MTLQETIDAYFSIPNYWYPRVGPDGDQIAVFGDPTGQHKLYIVDIDTGEIIPICSDQTPTDPNPNSMVWSPDGDAVYVMKNDYTYTLEQDDGETPVFRITLDGKSDHLFTIDGDCRLWSITDDPAYLYYQHDDGLHYYDLESETHGMFPRFPGFCHIGGGGVSPDGDRVAYTSDPLDDPSNGDVYVAALDGSDAQKLNISEDGRHTAAQAWHPDGTRLLVNEDVDTNERETRMGIYSLETGAIEWIANVKGIAFISDGQRILSGDNTADDEMLMKC